jgi:hypothetical protein
MVQGNAQLGGTDLEVNYVSGLDYIKVMDFQVYVPLGL